MGEPGAAAVGASPLASLVPRAELRPLNPVLKNGRNQDFGPKDDSPKMHGDKK